MGLNSYLMVYPKDEIKHYNQGRYYGVMCAGLDITLNTATLDQLVELQTAVARCVQLKRLESAKQEVTNAND